MLLLCFDTKGLYNAVATPFAKPEEPNCETKCCVKARQRKNRNISASMNTFAVYCLFYVILFFLKK